MKFHIFVKYFIKHLWFEWPYKNIKIYSGYFFLEIIVLKIIQNSDSQIYQKMLIFNSIHRIKPKKSNIINYTLQIGIYKNSTHYKLHIFNGVPYNVQYKCTKNL